MSTIKTLIRSIEACINAHLGTTGETQEIAIDAFSVTSGKAMSCYLVAKIQGMPEFLVFPRETCDEYRNALPAPKYYVRYRGERIELPAEVWPLLEMIEFGYLLSIPE